MDKKINEISRSVIEPLSSIRQLLGYIMKVMVLMRAGGGVEKRRVCYTLVRDFFFPGTFTLCWMAYFARLFVEKA